MTQINNTDKREPCPNCGGLHGWNGDAYSPEACKWPKIDLEILGKTLKEPSDG